MLQMIPSGALALAKDAPFVKFIRSWGRNCYLSIHATRENLIFLRRWLRVPSRKAPLARAPTKAVSGAAFWCGPFAFQRRVNGHFAMRSSLSLILLFSLPYRYDSRPYFATKLSPLKGKRNLKTLQGGIREYEIVS